MQRDQMRATPRKAGRTPTPGSRFLSDAVADNIHNYRSKARMSQTALAEHMERLGHSWSRATVSDVERSGRNLTVDEVLALAIAMGVTIPDLLDPKGIDGRNADALDYGGDAPMRADVASQLIRGAFAMSVASPGSISIEPVEGNPAAAMAALNVLSPGWSLEHTGSEDNQEEKNQ